MKKIFNERPILKLIILVGIFALLFFHFQAQNKNPALNERFSNLTDFSFEETTFYYGKHDYDVTSRSKSINSILSAVPVGEKIIVACHAGPKNEIYCIFDTVSKSFVADLKGNHLIWYNDDITTAVYSFWSDIYTYDGSIVKSYDLAENELIYDLALSDNNTKLIVTITCDNGSERTDVISLLDMI